ncbi:hypothetical protein B0H16DRAFT_1824093 [Mycena metata]|uniref:F-box domain-containing protein n=1 Tax=Mycena metata TaxID=1033252 RepID=A0AAD7J796_9AGAR|nr:hypothetical protein B0H16DRAFT_1824093 [Mycena metata]
MSQPRLPVPSSESCPSCGESVLSVQQLHDLLRSSLSPNTDDSEAVPEGLSDTHDPPLAIEIQTARVIVAHEKKRLRVLKDNIANCSEPDFGNTHLLAPIRRLATELLRAIFLFTVPPRRELLPATYDGFGTRVSPWILTCVCSRWRDISLSFPALWQTIVLPQTYFEDNSTDDSDADGTTQIYEYPYPLPMLQTQLVRSGKAPLRIIIQEDSQTIGKILPALTNPENAPEFNAPSLRDISLRPYGVTPPLPWAQITRLELEGSWDEILTVLPPMANLLNATSDKSAIVPALRKLYLRGTAHTTIPDNLCLPCLEDLFFTRGPLPTSLPLQDSGCQLKRLRFPGLASIEALLKLFRQFPTITDLATNMKLGSDDSDSMKNLQDLFSGLLADATLLPDLQRVAIHVAGIGGPLTSFAELANLIEARRISVSLGGRRGIPNKSHFAAFEKEVDIEVEADEDVWLESNGWALTSL